MNRLMWCLVVIGLVLSCDRDNRSQANEAPPAFHYVEGSCEDCAIRTSVYHDDKRNTTCWTAQSTYSGEPVAMTCIPDWQLSPPKQKGE
jgi:hypothetical protein